MCHHCRLSLSLSSHLSPPTLSCLGNSPESSDKLEVSGANINVVYLIPMAFDLFSSSRARGQPAPPQLSWQAQDYDNTGGGVRSTLRLAWPQRTHCLSSDELMFACFALVELPGQSSVSRSLPLPPASTSLRVRRSHISHLSSFINSSSPFLSSPLPYCFQSPWSSLYLFADRRHNFLQLMRSQMRRSSCL